VILCKVFEKLHAGTMTINGSVINWGLLLPLFVCFVVVVVVIVVFYTIKLCGNKPDGGLVLAVDRGMARWSVKLDKSMFSVPM